jgi:hypothetical protein
MSYDYDVQSYTVMCRYVVPEIFKTLAENNCEKHARLNCVLLTGVEPDYRISVRWQSAANLELPRLRRMENC